MAPRPDSRPDSAFLLSLHDVCPATWADYQPLLRALERHPRIPLTLLVVPDFHGGGRFIDDEPFCQALEQRRRRGDELVLHGYFHHDDSPPPTTPGGWVRRRLLTHEGEFAALDGETAAARIQRGLAMFHQLGWPARGFVPPGWMTSAGSRAAIAEAGFTYWTDRDGFHCPGSGLFLQTPTLVWSARSPWRRGLFQGVNRAREWAHRAAPVLRLAVHPVDMRHQRSRRAWITTIERLAGCRRALTKSQWLDELTGETV